MTPSGKQSVGSVWLIGAGPGDPNLITVHGLKLLRRADVVVHDALIDRGLLALARREAERINVGKRSGSHTYTQDQINELLLAQARRGRQVARLKGGDPYLFGRGAEEAAFLGRHGIRCRVIPGVTAATAASCTAGIPLTHRDYASTVTFVTGHEGPAKGNSAIDYRALAALVQSGGTCSFYMGMANLASITAELQRQGLGPGTPVAIVQSATLPSQRSLRTTLNRAQRDVHAAGLGAPAIIVVGPVAGMPPHGLDGFTTRPLFGQRIVITRARHQAGALAGYLQELGARVLAAPTIRLRLLDDCRALDRTIGQIGRHDWLILTSANGAWFLARRLDRLGLDVRLLGSVKVAAIGPATAQAMSSYLHIRADLVPGSFVGEALAAELIGQQAVAGKRVLLLRNDRARADLPGLLADAGAQVTDQPLYECRRPAKLPQPVLEALAQGRVDWVTFTSSQTASNMLALLGERCSLLQGIRIASIGPVTSKTLKQAGFAPHVEADPYTVQGLVDALVAYGRRHGPRGDSRAR